MLLILAAHATEVIVDDEDGAPAFTTTGSCWDTWSMGSYGYDGGDASYHYLTRYSGDGSRTGTATWSPELPSAGTWRIETWFRRTENRSSDADHVVTDGSGATTRVSIDQTGEGGSGWLSLGEYSCGEGRGGCTVTLDGDDGASDEANAMRFTLVSEPEVVPCEATPGAYTWQYTAGTVEGSAWTSASAARGEADGSEATIANLDDDEDLVATGWSVCDPQGEETITGVRIFVLARTQYDSGVYEVVVRLEAGGVSTTFNGTDLTWYDVEPTVRSWTEIAALTARLSLEEHPGGRRDSDVGVDAFRLEVDFTVAEELAAEEPEEELPTDTGTEGGGNTAPVDGPEDTGTPESSNAAPGASPGVPTRLDTLGCGRGAFAPVFLMALGRRRRRLDPSRALSCAGAAHDRP